MGLLFKSIPYLIYKCPRRINKTTLFPIAVSYFVYKSKLASCESDGAEHLNHMYLIKNASLSCIDSASSLLTQTTQNLIDLELQYTEALERLIALFDMSLKYKNNEFQQRQIWEAMVEVRHEVSRLKRERQEMEAMMRSAETMLNSAADAAMLAGAHYASTAAVERVFSAKTNLRIPQEKRLATETLLARTEAKLIAESKDRAKNKSQPTATVAKKLLVENDPHTGNSGVDTVAPGDDQYDVVAPPLTEDPKKADVTIETERDIPLESANKESFPEEFDVLFKNEQFEDNPKHEL